MKKRILTFSAIILFVMVDYLPCQDIDYLKMYKDLQDSIDPIDIATVEFQKIIDSKEFDIVIKGGIESFNVFDPYTKMEKSIKEVINELAYFRFTLRSATSTNIYQNSVPATVLIVAPVAEAIGAGFVIDKSKGLIITNYHVTSGLKSLLVTFYEEGVEDLTKLKYYSASVIRYNAKKDIAVLQLQSIPYNLKSLNFAEICSPKFGEEVHTIGHPMSLTWTYSHGLVTAVRKNFPQARVQLHMSVKAVEIDSKVYPSVRTKWLKL